MTTKSARAVMISIRAPGVAVMFVPGCAPGAAPERRHPVNPRAARLAFGPAARVMRGPRASLARALSSPVNCGSRPATLRIFGVVGVA